MYSLAQTVLFIVYFELTKYLHRVRWFSCLFVTFFLSLSVFMSSFVEFYRVNISSLGFYFLYRSFLLVLI